MTDLEQYQLVHQGIQAVAARCDGARTQDGVGFNGQDTHYGRRIAATPFEALDANDHEEIARIALTYKVQIETYTGLDVATLPVVRAAAGLSTNHASRENARRYERRRENISDRCVKAVDGRVHVSWAKKDPDFNALRDGARALPNRTWTGSAWDCAVCPQLGDFLEEFSFDVPADVAALLSAPAPAPAPERLVELIDGGRLKLTSKYDASLVDGIKRLKGRKYVGGPVNTCDATVANLRWLAENDFAGAADTLAYLEAEQGTVEAAASAAQTRAQLLTTVSSLADPNSIPEAFLALFTKATAR